MNQNELRAYLKERFQPIDYGLTYDDLNLYNWPTIWSCRLDDGNVIRCLGTRPDDKYKKGRRWFGVLLACKAADAYKPAGFALISHKKSDGWSRKHMISSKNDFEYVSSNPVDKANALHVEISSACLPRHPAVAYLFLVRCCSNVHIDTKNTKYL